MIPLYASMPFGLHLVDQNGDPAPCVELHTTDQQTMLSDATGWVAFDEPGLMDVPTWFEITPGYFTASADALGYRGQTFTPVAGQRDTMSVQKLSDPGACLLGSVNRDAVFQGGTDDPFELLVIDADTQRGVPMVLVSGPLADYWTDSAGRVAVRDPTLFGQDVTFEVQPVHGYHAPIPTQVTVTEGGTATLSLIRDNIAERLYRVTGRGIYRDSVLLGETPPTAEPLLSGRVMGQDSVMVVPGRKNDIWLWGATLGPSYPTSATDVAGAVVHPLADPEDGVDLQYFVNATTGFARPMVDVPKAPGEILSVAGPAVVDDGGVEKTIVFYTKTDGVDVTERGVAVWNDATNTFELDQPWLTTIPTVGISVPTVRDGYVYLEEGFRFPATMEAARTPVQTWDAYTPSLKGGTTDTWPDGTERWSWRPMHEQLLGRTVAEDTVVDVATGSELEVYSDSIAWSEWRHRFQRVFNQQGGDSSALGEVWYAEADTPVGPWEYATRIVTHDAYNVYDPYIHAEISGNGRRLLWEATTTAKLSTSEPIARYEYNQMMYALDLDEDPRLALPVPIYRTPQGLVTNTGIRDTVSDAVVEFYSPDRAGTNTIPVAWDGPACDGGKMVAGGTPLGIAQFHVARPTLSPPGAVPLRRATQGAEEGLFVTVPSGWQADPNPVGWVYPVGLRTHQGALDWLPEVQVRAGADVCASEAGPGDGYALHLDLGSSVGTSGGSWSIRLDDTEVATTAVSDLTVPVGRHVVVATWTSPDGVSWADERWLAITEVPEVEHTGDTGLPQETGDTDVPPTDGGTTDDDEDTGCGCATPGPATGWSALSLLALVAGRRRRR